jgi:hypothetical protein
MPPLRGALLGWLVVACCAAAVSCGSYQVGPLPAPNAVNCSGDDVVCAAAGIVCGEQQITDLCGVTRTVQCGPCGSNGSCALNGRSCVCNPGYSGDGWTCAASIGSPCPIGNGTQQNCPDGQVCISSQGVNLCDIVNCQTDLECGTNGIATNSCALTGGTSVCQINCFPTLPNPCNNPDLVCLPANTTLVTDASQCAISCLAEPASWCPQVTFGSVCASDGLCKQVPCTTNADCPTGQICSIPSNGVTSAFCAPDCRIAGNSCPSNSSLCDQSTGMCT